MHDDTRRLPQASHNQGAGELLELYCQAFEARYKVKPILAPDTDQPVAFELVRAHGLAKAKALVERYLKMDEWLFNQKRHPLSLLKREINVVNTALAASKPSAPMVGLQIRFDASCDRCGTLESRMCTPEEIPKTFLCSGCVLGDLRKQMPNVRSNQLMSYNALHRGIGKSLPGA